MNLPSQVTLKAQESKALLENQSFLVIDKANVLELLPPEKTLEECIGACAVETGRLLQAAYIVALVQ